ncbi:MAG TPA: hypothetical protein VH796_19235 [Nitrososphaeraceae archaeon]
MTGLYKAITEDFKGAWDSIAANPGNIDRGNFMFAQAMTLLEFVARFYGCDNNPRQIYSEELHRIRTEYFTVLPGPVASYREFELPHLDEKSIFALSTF